MVEGIRRKQGKHGWVEGTYTEMKRSWGRLVRQMAEGYSLPLREEVYMTYLIFEPNRRRDPSNVRAGAVKIIEDGLKGCALSNDGWRNILDSREFLAVDKEAPGVAVFLSDERVLERDEAMEMQNG